MSESLGDEERSAALLLPPGYAYHAVLVCFVGMVAFALFVALVGGDELDLAILVIPIVLLGLGLSRYHQPRQIVVNARGITLEVGTKATHLNWNEVRSVRFVTEKSTVWVYVPTVSQQFSVRTGSFRRRISVRSEFFALPPHSLERVAEAAINIARAKGIPIKDGVAREKSP